MSKTEGKSRAILLAYERHDADVDRAGAPLLLLHSLALDRHVWDATLPRLRKHRDILTVDLRGHGASSASAAFTIEEMADDVAATLDSVGIDEVCLAGLSLGGSVAQAFATRHPHRTVALALIDTTAWYGPTAVQQWADRAAKAHSAGMRSLSAFQLDRWFSDKFRAENQDLCQDLLDRFARNDLASYEATCCALGAFDLRGPVATIDVPTLVVVGSDDPATPLSYAEDLSERIPHASLRVLPGARHLTPVERPRDVGDLLDTFFARHPA
jgi:3-oxoadipate enol-lactonase